MTMEEKPSVTVNPQLQGHSGSKKVGVVCRDCNAGWLSKQVEIPAKPILVPLIAGRSGTLNVIMQRIIATWAVKTIMTAEHVNKGKSVVRQIERDWLRDNLSPPAGWFVSAMPYNGTEWRDLGIFQHTGTLDIPPVNHDAPTEYNLGLTFMGLGRLFFLVRHSTWPRLWDVLGIDVPHVCRIWPSTHEDIQWPPPLVFSDIEAKYFTTYLARVLNEPV